MKKPQNPKPRNESLMRAMQDKRSSSAASPERNKKRYSRTDRRDTSWKNGY